MYGARIDNKILLDMIATLTLVNTALMNVSALTALALTNVSLYVYSVGGVQKNKSEHARARGPSSLMQKNGDSPY